MVLSYSDLHLVAMQDYDQLGASEASRRPTCISRPAGLQASLWQNSPPKNFPPRPQCFSKARALAPVSDLRGKRGHEEDPSCLQEEMPGKWVPHRREVQSCSWINNPVGGSPEHNILCKSVSFRGGAPQC